MTAKKRPLSGGKKKAKELPKSFPAHEIMPPELLANLTPELRLRLATPTDLYAPSLAQAVSYLSRCFEAAQTPDEFSALYDTLNDTADALTKIKEMTKARLLSAVTSEGTQVTEKGTRRLTVNNWQIEARPHRTGMDDKKVEALLRAKGYTDLSRGMEQVITYKASSDKLATLVSAGILTQDELDTCNVDFTWALRLLKRVVENNNDGDNGEYT